MSYAAAVAALEARLSALWAETPIFFTGELVERPDPPAPVLQVEEGDATGRIAAIGSGPTIRHSGSLVMTIWAPADLGRGWVREAQERLGALFLAGDLIGGARIWSPSYGRVLLSADDVGWLMAEVTIRFDVDVHHAAA